MALEIERRFLVQGSEWRRHVIASQNLRQGYLAANAEGVTVRMRLSGNQRAWLTLKAAADSTGLVRHEFEYDIPVADAEALWTLAGHRLEKTRHHLDLPGGEWVVDCFSGANAPLVLLEVELPTKNTPISVPNWCSAEITGDSRWANAVLAQKPLQSWVVEDRRRFGFE